MSDYRVPAVVGAIKILEELGVRGESGATQAELAASTGLSKSTLHNLLSTLEADNFVRRDPGSRIYRLGAALIPLGAAATRQIQLVKNAIDRIAPLAGIHGLSFAVAQRTTEGDAQVIERFYPPHDVHVGITIGSRYGPLDGALGKVLLSGMDRDEAAKAVEAGRLPAHTPATITSPASLLDEVDEVRVRGWASSLGELNENHAIAAPIWGPSGQIELLLLALGFPTQLDGPMLAETGQLLHGQADSIMAESGITPPTRPTAGPA